MKNIAITSLIAVVLSTTIVLANDTTNRTLSLESTLPKSIPALETPAPAPAKKVKPVEYSPEQKAEIVNLELTSK
ncbi:hypothetical protein [Arundinibacter roseus]|uniref:Uncharacterized protein n=1 Tax=Arundinibacter roseus TaxID=2070510 RepID=A0A4R4K3N2_9BACT|nr:hypothetical protein [Arundinibacter roseus]TDB61823.1 hypothetical protein EZE20_18940 [Arundinibacter roseus]